MIEYEASYHFFRKRFYILTFFFHRFFYIWQARAKENPHLAAPLAIIKRLLFRIIART
jgi:hypothetical protein